MSSRNARRNVSSARASRAISSAIRSTATLTVPTNLTDTFVNDLLQQSRHGQRLAQDCRMPRHSYRSASIGFNCAAFFAG
jgi:hypothetical protein